MEFQPNVYVDGQLVKPSWCLLVKTKYLKGDQNEIIRLDQKSQYHIQLRMSHLAPLPATMSAISEALKNSMVSCEPKF